MIITDCTQTAVFQTTGNQTNMFNHNSGGSETPGNCTKGLGLPLPCPCGPNGTPYTYGGGAFVFQAISRSFFVGNASNGVPSLFARDYTNGDDAGSPSTLTTDSELVQGIESIQILPYSRIKIGPRRSINLV